MSYGVAPPCAAITNERVLSDQSVYWLNGGYLTRAICRVPSTQDRFEEGGHKRKAPVKLANTSLTGAVKHGLRED
jgi:hypothetical protein